MARSVVYQAWSEFGPSTRSRRWSDDCRNPHDVGDEERGGDERAFDQADETVHPEDGRRSESGRADS